MISTELLLWILHWYQVFQKKTCPMFIFGHLVWMCCYSFVTIWYSIIFSDGGLHAFENYKLILVQARSKDHRHLLPVITSFMALNWSRISVHYNTNMIFSSVLVALLTYYIFINYTGIHYLFNLGIMCQTKFSFYLGLSLGVKPPLCLNTTDDVTTDTGDWSWGNSVTTWWSVTGLMVLLVVGESLQLSVHPSQNLASVE